MHLSLGQSMYANNTGKYCFLYKCLDQFKTDHADSTELGIFLFLYFYRFGMHSITGITTTNYLSEI